MAEPARKHPCGEDREPDAEPSFVLLQRWVERPDGSLELLEMPLTPEDFLDPQLEDKMVQGGPHQLAVQSLAAMLSRHFRSQEDVAVLSDMKHLFGPGIPGPAPDISVVRGARHSDPRKLPSFDAMKQGVVPCLVIEVVSPFDARIRRTDEVDKMALYQRVGIPEYLLVDMPRRATDYRFRIKGQRLSVEGRYRLIEPDAQGFLLSETTQLRFGVSPSGDRVRIVDVRTGESLLDSWEVEQAHLAAEERAAREERGRRTAEDRAAREERGRRAAEEKVTWETQERKAAEERAAREEAARKAAEAELERLRAEIERLQKER